MSTRQLISFPLSRGIETTGGMVSFVTMLRKKYETWRSFDLFFSITNWLELTESMHFRKIVGDKILERKKKRIINRIYQFCALHILDTCHDWKLPSSLKLLWEGGKSDTETGIFTLGIVSNTFLTEYLQHFPSTFNRNGGDGSCCLSLLFFHGMRLKLQRSVFPSLGKM